MDSLRKNLQAFAINFCNYKSLALVELLKDTFQLVDDLRDKSSSKWRKESTEYFGREKIISLAPKKKKWDIFPNSIKNGDQWQL